MSQIDEIIKEHLGKILTGIAAVGGGIWGWIRFRRKDKAETDKTEIDVEISKIKAQALKDKYYEEQETKWIKKIESLTKRLEDAEKHQVELQKQLDYQKLIVIDLKAELNLYKTIRSTERPDNSI